MYFVDKCIKKIIIVQVEKWLCSLLFIGSRHIKCVDAN